MSRSPEAGRSAGVSCCAAAGHALVCRVLNRLFWKCPIPERMMGPDAENDWAEYWLGELRDGPEGCEIEGITWDRGRCEFVGTHTEWYDKVKRHDKLEAALQDIVSRGFDPMDLTRAQKIAAEALKGDLPVT